MDLAVDHPAFSGRGLLVRRTFLKGTRLVVDNQETRGRRRKYRIRDNSGREVDVRLKSHMFDPIPTVEIDGQTYRVARPLTWYEYAWMALPILLVFAGGAVGLLLGVSSLYASTHVFRGGRSAFAKYCITAGISVTAVLVMLVVAVTVQLAIEGVPE